MKAKMATIPMFYEEVEDCQLETIDGIVGAELPRTHVYQTEAKFE